MLAAVGSSQRPHLAPELTDFKNICLVYRAEALVALHGGLECVCGDSLDLGLLVDHGVECKPLPSFILVESLQVSLEFYSHMHVGTGQKACMSRHCPIVSAAGRIPAIFDSGRWTGQRQQHALPS